MSTKVTAVTREKLGDAYTAKRQVREAWEDCYVRLTETLEAAHRGYTPRVALAELQDAATKASQQVARARLEEERACSAYVDAVLPEEG